MAPGGLFLPYEMGRQCYDEPNFVQDAIYGKGNKGPLNSVLKRKAEDKETQDLDVKVRADSFLLALHTFPSSGIVAAVLTRKDG